MKKLALFTGVVLLFAPLLLAGSGQAAKEAADTLPAGQARAVIPVSGMSCGGCCAKIESAVKTLDGVVDVKADYEKGQATVTYEKDKVDVKKIVQTINDKTGFKAKKPQEEKAS